MYLGRLLASAHINAQSKVNQNGREIHAQMVEKNGPCDQQAKHSCGH